MARTAAMPALAQASSLSPPGAPETPTAPTRDPAASTMTPPAMMVAPGSERMPACGEPGPLVATRSLVMVRKLTAVQALPGAVAQQNLRDAEAVDHRDRHLKALLLAIGERGPRELQSEIDAHGFEGDQTFLRAQRRAQQRRQQQRQH